MLPENSSDSMGVADPVWSESNWASIQLRVFLVQDPSYDYIILFVGIGLTVLSYIAIVVARSIIAKSLKRD